MHKHSALTWLPLLITIGIMLCGQIMAKKAGILIQNGSSLLNIFSLLSYTCLLLRGILWIWVVRKLRLVFAYPVLSLNYILVLAVSSLLFKEAITVFNAGGALLIAAGVILTGIGERYGKGGI